MHILAILAKAILVPPANLFVLGFVGWLLLRSSLNLGRTLLAFSGTLLILLSLPVVAHSLSESLKEYPALDISRVDGSAGAIVIIGAETVSAREFGDEIVGPYSLNRIRYGARLHKRFRLPVLVTGGYVNNGDNSVAELMAKALEEDFGVVVRWRETKSRDTNESALFTADVLREHDIKTVYLVTDALDMVRLKKAFEALNVAVIPAPVNVTPADQDFSYRDFLPTARAMFISAEAIYEYLKCLRDYVRN